MRPTYREPLAVRTGPLIAGLAAGAIWMTAFGLLGASLHAYSWWSITAGLVAWVVLAVLSRRGSRGVAVGVAISVASGLSVTLGILIVRFLW